MYITGRIGEIENVIVVIRQFHCLVWIKVQYLLDC